MSSDGVPDRKAQGSGDRGRWLFGLPVAMFVLLAAGFLVALLMRDPQRLPSVLINKPVPEFDLAALDGLKQGATAVPGLASRDLQQGGPYVVNVWASWCGPCREEQPLLGVLAERARVPLVGINYKDRPANALAFLTAYGNPFTRVGVDPAGRAAINWGVYGVPETYVIDRQGRITFKHIGPISPTSIETDLLPAIERARQ